MMQHGLNTSLQGIQQAHQARSVIQTEEVIETDVLWDCAWLPGADA